MQENVQKVKQQLKATHGVSKEGRILMKEVLPWLHTPCPCIHEQPFPVKDNGSQTWLLM